MLKNATFDWGELWSKSMRCMCRVDVSIQLAYDTWRFWFAFCLLFGIVGGIQCATAVEFASPGSQIQRYSASQEENGNINSHLECFICTNFNWHNFFAYNCFYFLTDEFRNLVSIFEEQSISQSRSWSWSSYFGGEQNNQPYLWKYCIECSLLTRKVCFLWFRALLFYGPTH